MTNCKEKNIMQVHKTFYKRAANTQNTTEMFPEDTFSGELLNGANGDNLLGKSKVTMETAKITPAPYNSRKVVRL